MAGPIADGMFVELPLVVVNPSTTTRRPGCSRTPSTTSTPNGTTWRSASSPTVRSAARAIEHLRAVCGELQIAGVRQQLSFSLFTDFENFATFTPAPLHNDAAITLFDQRENWAGALKPLRG